ncbi:Uncharacterized conserved protein YndB, AHSA1/START domain [Aliiroseovarius halocynthiae]|uniref:SRPBCC domain-containing protein n=1 Tax=Aliiroseovarius halocynthiae TaxID=985055 RepID=A0A545SYE5_9RHOB|nr:SRPBCC domain-containing protein [Aliiroseovarius halocynthiae]TQV69982.1 SRPBCC domain-containing protein [Aliiroseovarius halocynthiae]SMR70648.1 Uncharacterized conserved protein YndB, AHSA1/START domain [Aliiroseovarius halocynthiae]
MRDAFIQQIDIEASIETVFDHFVKPEFMVRWMGEFARLDAQDGGLFSVDIDGVLIRGEYTKIDRPTFIEIAWGEAGNELMPPGSTQLSISLQDRGGSTSLTLTHSGLQDSEFEKHAYGWPIFLARLDSASRGQDPGAYPWSETN